MTDFANVIESIGELTSSDVIRTLSSTASNTRDERRSLFHNTNKIIDASLDEGTVHGLKVALKVAQWEVRYFTEEDAYASDDHTLCNVKQTIADKMDDFLASGSQIIGGLINTTMPNHQKKHDFEPEQNVYKIGEQVVDLMIDAMHFKDRTIDQSIKSPFNDAHDQYVKNFDTEMVELNRLKTFCHAKAEQFERTHPDQTVTETPAKIIPMPVTPVAAPGLTG